MVRKFRAIVETSTEPKDHEVIWFYEGKLRYWGNGAWEPFLDIDAIEVNYKTVEDESLSTVEEALDKLLYVTPEISSFTIEPSGPYERGNIIINPKFKWEYNKDYIVEQKFEDNSIPLSTQEVTLNRNITEDTTFTLSASDGTNTVTKTISIEFTDFIYFGTMVESGGFCSQDKIASAENSFTVVADPETYDFRWNLSIWIFIPYSLDLKTIWHNNIDSTDAFVKIDDYIMYPSLNKSHTIDHVVGSLYVSKQVNLGKVELKLT